MILDKNLSHNEVVNIWEKQNLSNQECKDLIKLYSSAFLALEKRCLLTLSNVTVQVVIDRVLHEGHNKYPVLNFMTFQNPELALEKLIQNCEQLKFQELRDALRFLLVELLTVIGNITSDVLTAPLHKELFQVSATDARIEKNEGQNERR